MILIDRLESYLRNLLLPPPPYTYKRMVARGLLAGVMLGPLLGFAMIVSAWTSLAASFFMGFLTIFLFTTAGFVWIGSFLLGIVGLCVLFIKKTRPIGVALILQCAIIVPTSVALGQFRWDIRRSAFERLAERSAQLIAAIDGYYSAYGEPPATLEAMVPDWIPEIPVTGIGAYPEYAYFARGSASPAHPNFPNDPWILMVRTTDMGFDHFVYAPSKSYPSKGAGGVYERIGDWGYLHE